MAVLRSARPEVVVHELTAIPGQLNIRKFDRTRCCSVTARCRINRRSRVPQDNRGDPRHGDGDGEGQHAHEHEQFSEGHPARSIPHR
jgi:hypothetical protein